MAGSIHVRGAREHNLKNVDVVIPRDRLTVITGLSGSGKSSLAFDTIYAEGQRRYVESLSAYARQFLELMGKPDVDSIEGLSPAISIEQKTTSRNPRSTVGTVTEIHDYMRLLWARTGVPYSPATGLPIEAQTVSQMVDRVMAMPEGTRLLLLAPVVRDRKGEYRKELAELQRRGFTRVKVDGKLYEIGEVPSLNRKIKHEIEAVVDRIVVRDGIAPRLADSFETALALSDGIVYAENADAIGDSPDRTVFSSRFACPVSGFSIEEIEPRLFSFNSPHGACPACDGLGVESFFDPELVVPDERLSLAGGAVMPWTGAQSPYYDQTLQSLARHFKVRTSDAWQDLPAKVRDAILNGTGDEPVAFTYKDGVRAYTVTKPFEGVVRNLQRRYQETDSVWVREELSRYQAEKPCAVCKGARLKPEALAVRVGGKNIAEASELSIRVAAAWFETVIDTMTPQRQEIAQRILREICERLQFLVDVGLDYLTLSRSSATLSGGESQRIRLASQIGSGLTGVLYVLDEPSIGLHQRDNERLLGTLRRLRDLGNTVLVVEHDEEAIRAADHLIDMGPAAGIDGGRVVAEGTPAEVSANPKSLTGDYLAGRRRIDVPVMRRPMQKDRILRVVNARGNNLKSISAGFPLGTFTCVTGVSGGGKSTLVVDTLYKATSRRLMGAGEVPAPHDHIEGLELLDKIIDIDQSPISRTPRSNPATYTDLFAPIRDWFAELPESACARLQTGTLQLQREGWTVRGVPGRRRAKDRDALPARRLRPLRRVQGPALQSRDAGNQVPRQVDRRSVGDDSGRSGAVFQCSDAHPRQAAYPPAGRAWLHRARAAGHDAVGRRSAADQAVEGTGTPCHGAHVVHTGRAHHRPALRGCAQAVGGAARTRRSGEHGRGDRAQSGSDQDRRLDSRSRSRGRRRRRPHRGGGDARGYCRTPQQLYRPLPVAAADARNNAAESPAPRLINCH